MGARVHRPTGRGLYVISQVTLLGAAAAGVVLTWENLDWHPLWVAGVLAALAIGAHAFAIRIGNQRLSASFIALVLAMVVLGPAPAAVIGFSTMFVDGARRRMWRQPLPWLTNAATYAAFPLAGAFLVTAILGQDVHGPSGLRVDGPTLAAAVCAVYVATNLINFGLIATHYRVVSGRGIFTQAQTLLVPMLPSELAAAVLTALFATAYAQFHQGAIVILGLVVVLAVFMAMVRALARSEDRADQLAARSRQLAHLQVGVLATLLETLALRDPPTSRHGAAVARLARALAQELSLPEREQDLVHTAGLLHDIGKFALPDRILHATALREEDWPLVRRHCQDGAALVGRLDGYGPVAQIILYHHERIDGTGYPAGLIGREIPQLARIIAVCETYDALTGRDSYRTAVTPVEAFAELRRVAGRQLDADLVDRLIVLLQRDGRGLLVSGEVQDATADAAFTRLAQAMAEP
ncbi:MAG: HD domain-containing protein [Solirubrobacterales bacterium]|nr:HD domain-containing protein [Solirubrobacterales bacterium]